MNENQLKRMQIRAEKYAKVLERVIYEEIGIGKYNGFGHCVATENVVSRFLSKLPNNLPFDNLDDVCYLVDTIIKKNNGSCSSCFSETSFSICVEGLDETHYYKSGHDRCRFENFNSDVAGMIADCFCEKFDDTDGDGNRHWLIYYRPVPYRLFRKELFYDTKRTLTHWVNGYRPFKIEVYGYEVDSFNGFCEGFLGSYDFEEVVEHKGIEMLAGSYVDLCASEIHDAYIKWFETRNDD